MGGKGAEQGGGKPFTMTIGGQTYGGASGPRPAQPGEGSKQSQPARQATSRGSSNEGPTRRAAYDRSAYSPGGGKQSNMRGGAGKAAGGALGALAGGLMLGGPGALYLGYKGIQSGKDGWIGDMMNARSYEQSRDRMESSGISRKDTALAAKHGIADSYASSLLDEGEDYDSITGEYF